jgi:NADP-dependent 3-hydroxy acid dehydrogenase YdfG
VARFTPTAVSGAAPSELGRLDILVNNAGVTFAC